MSKATFIYADNAPFNCSNFRILTPAKYLVASGHTIEKFHISEIQNKKEVSDVVLIERAISPEIVKHVRSLGAKRIIVTFDDAYHLLGVTQPGYGFWRERRNIVEFRKGLKLADKAVCPSERLATDYHCDVMPNYHEPELWPTPIEKTSREKVIIGWGGSSGHFEAWQDAEFVTALGHVLDENPQAILRVHSETALHGLIGMGLRVEEHPGWLNSEKWADAVRDFDIGLAPLRTKFDTRRSNAKIVEYGLAGVPFVATMEIPYIGAPGGALVSSGKEWRRTLNALVRNEFYRRQYAAAGLKWARRWLMPDHVGEYEALLWG